jgi:hypothetical protein
VAGDDCIAIETDEVFVFRAHRSFSSNKTRLRFGDARSGPGRDGACARVHGDRRAVNKMPKCVHVDVRKAQTIQYAVGQGAGPTPVMLCVNVLGFRIGLEPSLEPAHHRQ